MKKWFEKLPAGMGQVMISLSFVVFVLVIVGFLIGIRGKPKKPPRSKELVVDVTPDRPRAEVLEEELKTIDRVWAETKSTENIDVVEPPETEFPVVEEMKPSTVIENVVAEELKQPEIPLAVIKAPPVAEKPRKEEILVVQSRPNAALFILPVSTNRIFEGDPNAPHFRRLTQSLPQLLSEAINSQLTQARYKRFQTSRIAVDIKDHTEFKRLGEGAKTALIVRPYILALETRTGDNRGYQAQARLEVVRTSFTIEIENVRSGAFSSFDVAAKATLEPGASRLRQQKLLLDELKEKLIGSRELIESLERPADTIRLQSQKL